MSTNKWTTINLPNEVWSTYYEKDYSFKVAVEAYSSTVSKICFDEKDALVNLKNNQEYSEENLCENWTDPETIAFIIWLDVKNTDYFEQTSLAFYKVSEMSLMKIDRGDGCCGDLGQIDAISFETSRDGITFVPHNEG